MTAAEAGVALLHRTAELLVSRFAEGDFRDEATRAKSEYFELGGKVFDDDGDVFEARLASFLEWYVIERPLQKHGVAPVRVWLRELAPDSDTARALAVLATSHRSLFDVGAVTEHAVELEDLLGGARFSVTERRSTVGFEPGQIVEARLLWDGERVVFGKTFLFHPREARQEVLDLVDHGLSTSLSPNDILFQLARLHLRWYRSRQISAVRIYGESRVAVPSETPTSERA
ncbi:MAG: hypothetical protein SF187_15770 [Deltaproteobacteria bacterium]|nr:hypothetical protein [Deltaproteobacteria bacterium]